MHEGGFDAHEGSFFQVAAGLAEFQTFQDDFADAEGFADEVVQWHAVGEQVAAGIEVFDGVIEFVVGGFDRFAGDEGDFVFGLTPAFELGGADAGTVAIAAEAFAGDGFDRGDVFHWAFRLPRDGDGEEFAGCHGDILREYGIASSE